MLRSRMDGVTMLDSDLTLRCSRNQGGKQDWRKFTSTGCLIPSLSLDSGTIIEKRIGSPSISIPRMYFRYLSHDRLKFVRRLPTSEQILKFLSVYFPTCPAFPYCTELYVKFRDDQTRFTVTAKFLNLFITFLLFFAMSVEMPAKYLWWLYNLIWCHISLLSYRPQMRIVKPSKLLNKLISATAIPSYGLGI